jgi:MFS family permease
MTIGVVLTSIVTGRLISRLGRYRIFPIVGTAVATAGMLLLATMDLATSPWLTTVYLVVLGIGLGMVMQVPVLVIQNAVPRSELGVATSMVPFARTMGGSFGTSAFGAILAFVLAAQLPSHLVTGKGGVPDPARLAHLSGPERQQIIDVFVQATNTVFLIAAGITAAAFLLSWFLKEIPLRGPGRLPGGAEAPREPDRVSA